MMVSHADCEERSLSIRHPVSLTSHPSVTAGRRHRHRSHLGASNYQPQNEFPFFTFTGDVEILLACGRKERRYLLHRLILCQCSAVLEDCMDGEGAHGGEGSSSSASRDAMVRYPDSAVGIPERKRWRFELDWAGRQNGFPVLVPKLATSHTAFGSGSAPQPPSARSKPPASHTGFFRSIAQMSAVNLPAVAAAADPADEIFRDYDNLFRVFYNYPPVLDPVNIADAYVECKSLLQLADVYDALDVIGPRVDHHLLRFQGRLWKQIAKYSPSYLKLGYLARSKAIFTESLIHVVGQWPHCEGQLRGKAPQHLIDVIEDKADELEEVKVKIEVKLHRLTLTTTRGERIGPHNAYLDWLVVSLFRQWLAEHTAPPLTSILKDTTRSAAAGNQRLSIRSRASSITSTSNAAAAAAPPALPFNSGRVFRLISSAGSAYLGHDELKRFLKLRSEDYSRDNLRRFERRMDELKNLAKELVRPLNRNFLELDLGKEGGSLPYLTCTKVTQKDYPWEE